MEIWIDWVESVSNTEIFSTCISTEHYYSVLPWQFILGICLPLHLSPVIVDGTSQYMALCLDLPAYSRQTHSLPYSTDQMRTARRQQFMSRLIVGCVIFVCCTPPAVLCMKIIWKIPGFTFMYIWEAKELAGAVLGPNTLPPAIIPCVFSRVYATFLL